MSNINVTHGAESVHMCLCPWDQSQRDSIHPWHGCDDIIAGKPSTSCPLTSSWTGNVDFNVCMCVPTRCSCLVSSNLREMQYRSVMNELWSVLHCWKTHTNHWAPSVFSASDLFLHSCGTLSFFLGFPSSYSGAQQDNWLYFCFFSSTFSSFCHLFNTKRFEWHFLSCTLMMSLECFCSRNWNLSENLTQSQASSLPIVPSL